MECGIAAINRCVKLRRGCTGSTKCSLAAKFYEFVCPWEINIRKVEFLISKV